jgi:hypothetical protein
MPTYDQIIVTSLLLGFVIWECFSGVYKCLEKEWRGDVVSFAQLRIFKPLAMPTAFAVSMLFLPESVKQVKE